MGFFDRLAFGWRMGTTSLGVVARDKTLMLFPVISGISGLLFAAAFIFGIGPDHFMQHTHDGNGDNYTPTPVGYGLAFTLYMVLSFITVYFNVALIGAAQQSINGKDTVLGDGFGVANQHLGKIAAWALLSGTVGLLLGMLESNEKIGRIVRSILGTAWTVITYFVVPVMIFENQAPTAAIGRSIALMKSTWGENAGAQVGIGLLCTVLVIVMTVVSFGVSMLIPHAAIVLLPLWVVSILLLSLALMAAKAVLAVGLYEFATKSGGGGAFKREELQAAFQPK